MVFTETNDVGAKLVESELATVERMQIKAQAQVDFSVSEIQLDEGVRRAAISESSWIAYVYLIRNTYDESPQLTGPISRRATI